MFCLVEDEEDTDEEAEDEEEQETEEEVEYVEDFEESDAEDVEDITGDMSDEEEKELIKTPPRSKKRPLEIEYEPTATKSKERVKNRRQPSTNGTHA